MTMEDDASFQGYQSMSISTGDWEHGDWEDHKFLNPPFSDQEDLMYRFAHKLLAEIEVGRVTEALLLTDSRTTEDWFQALLPVAASICFVRGDWVAAPFPARIFFYFGPNGAQFEDVFQAFALIVVPRASHPAETTLQR